MVFGGEYAPETVRAGKSEGVFEVEVTVRDGRVVDGTDDRAKGSVVVVCYNAITRCSKCTISDTFLLPSQV